MSLRLRDGIVGQQLSPLKPATVNIERGNVLLVTADAACDFFLESVPAFEMVRRGFPEAPDLALLERRHAAMLRQLSDFLADASLALNGPDSVHEVLRLVAEQARELVGAECAVASVEVGGDDCRPLGEASFFETDGPGQQSWRGTARRSPARRCDRSAARHGWRPKRCRTIRCHAPCGRGRCHRARSAAGSPRR